MAADYYQDVHQLWRRTKAILFYPIVVAVTGIGLCLLLGRMASFAVAMGDSGSGGLDANHAAVSGSFGPLMTIPLILVGLMSVVAVALLNSKSRNWLVWKMPGFREARVAQVAGGLGMMLGNGSSLPEALELAGQFEGGSAAGRDLALWKRQLAAGQSDLSADPSSWEAMPVLLAWFMKSARGDLGEGFRRASVYYRDRAVHRLDLLINGAMPALVLFLGSVILCQGVIAIRALVPSLHTLVEMQ
jgi:type II secretory pathway component PulF